VHYSKIINTDRRNNARFKGAKSMPAKYLVTYLCGVASCLESEGILTIDDSMLRFSSEGAKFSISIGQIVKVEAAEVDDLKKATGSYLALGNIGLGAASSMAKNRLMKITFKDAAEDLQSAEFKFLHQSPKEANYYLDAANEISRLKQNSITDGTVPSSSDSTHRMAEKEPVKTPEHQPFLTMKDKKFRRTRKLLLAAIAASLIILVILAGLIITTSPKTTITGMTLHIQYPNAGDSYFGAATQSVPINTGQSSELKIEKGEEFYLSFSFSASAAENISHTIKVVAISTAGFAIVTVTPSIPITLMPGNSTTITLDFQSPNTVYTGSIDVDFTVS
jgi:hypothetical protein